MWGGERRIYAAIKFLQEWSNPLTVINYLLLGTMSGFTLVTAFASYSAPDLVRFFGVWTTIITVTAFLTRSASLIRNARIKYKSSIQTAIGIRHNQIQQKSMGFMGGSFNTREFFHHRPDRVVRVARLAFLVLVFPAPVLLLGAAWGLSLYRSWVLVHFVYVAWYFRHRAERGHWDR